MCLFQIENTHTRANRVLPIPARQIRQFKSFHWIQFNEIEVFKCFGQAERSIEFMLSFRVRLNIQPFDGRNQTDFFSFESFIRDREKELIRSTEEVGVEYTFVMRLLRDGSITSNACVRTNVHSQ